jgi:dienelactone hydrolase
VTPQQIALRSHDGTRLAGLFWAAPAGAPGVVVVHGHGSQKEFHADFAERLSGAGLAALTLDLRGHGASDGDLDAGCLDDVVTAVDELAARGHAPVGLRGSSMGGLLALLAAERRGAVRAVVAICPAQPERMPLLVGEGWPAALRGPLRPHRTGVARGLWHATGDDRVPWFATRALAARCPQPRQLRIVLGGSHTSLQHDPGVHAQTTAFLSEHLAKR